MRRVLFLIVALGTASCAYTRIVVHEGRPGERTPRQLGRDVELSHLSTKGFKGQKPGFFVVRAATEWVFVWSDPRPDRPRTPPPPDVDWATQLVLVATSRTQGARSIELTNAVRTENGALQVYAVEELPGQGCTVKPRKRAPMDVGVVSGAFDEVVFWVDRNIGTTCGARPTARVECRVSGKTGATDKLTASPGDTLHCDGMRSDPGSAHAIVERNWYLTSTAPGSTSKIKVSDGAKIATAELDAYGTYEVRHEISDDEARAADASAIVLVPPPADAIMVQLGWSKITSGDDPSTFPRVELLGTEVPAKLGSGVADKTCTSAPGSVSFPQAPWCQVRTVAHVVQLRLAAAEKQSYRFGVRYVDERFQGGPMVCLRVFTKGKPPAETCDDNTRKAGDVWDAGVLDPETGALLLFDPGKK